MKNPVKSERFVFRATPGTIEKMKIGRAFIFEKFGIQVSESEFVRMCVETYVKEKLTEAERAAYPQSSDTPLAMVAQEATPAAAPIKKTTKKARLARAVAAVSAGKPQRGGATLSA